MVKAGRWGRPAAKENMKLTVEHLRQTAEARLVNKGTTPDLARVAGNSCAWLEACGYPGLTLLLEAMGDPPPDSLLVADALGIDLRERSCVFLGPAIAAHVARHGRVFLRNVRHGLYLVPLSVAANIGIGCPVDPAFALGGERLKNPYPEKLAAAARDGLVIADALWHALLTA
jgi:hypothetical protein